MASVGAHGGRARQQRGGEAVGHASSRTLPRPWQIPQTQEGCEQMALEWEVSSQPRAPSADHAPAPRPCPCSTSTSPARARHPLARERAGRVQVREAEVKGELIQACALLPKREVFVMQAKGGVPAPLQGPVSAARP